MNTTLQRGRVSNISMTCPTKKTTMPLPIPLTARTPSVTPTAKSRWYDVEVPSKPAPCVEEKSPPSDIELVDIPTATVQEELDLSDDSLCVPDPEPSWREVLRRKHRLECRRRLALKGLWPPTHSQMQSAVLSHLSQIRARPQIDTSKAPATLQYSARKANAVPFSFRNRSTTLNRTRLRR